MTPYQVNVAAEAFTAMALSQAGYDVAMQYGTTQPDWDILATKLGRSLMVQVKGSQDGGWGLFQKHLKNADYHGALHTWEKLQVPGLVYFLVQFSGVAAGSNPRCYVARPNEILQHMLTTRRGFGNTALLENYAYSRGAGAGHVDTVPAGWALSAERLDSV